jgi:hypothetical protein
MRLASLLLGLGFLVACTVTKVSVDDDVGGANSGGAGGQGPGGGATGPMGATGPVTSSSAGGALTCSEAYTDITGDCDLLAQDCPQGQWCDVSGTTAACVPTTGSLKTIGMKCSQGECAAGMRCVGNYCSPYCCPATDEPCGEGTCDIHLTFGTSYAMMCSFNAACTLFAGDCPDGMDCHIGDADSGLAVCDLPSAGMVGEGEVCIYRNDCGESQICNKNGNDKDGENGKCRNLCIVSKWEQLEVPKGGCLAERVCTMVNAGTFMDLGMCLP